VKSAYRSVPEGKDEAFIKREVQRIAQEQQQRVFKERIRYDGVVYRMDHRKLRDVSAAAKAVGWDVTYINAGDRRKGDFTHYQIDYGKRYAVVRDKPSMWSEFRLGDFLGVPERVAVFLRAFLTKRTPQGLVPDPSRIVQLLARGVGGVKGSIERSTLADRSVVDAFCVRQGSAGTVVWEVKCDGSNYDRVLEAGLYNPVSGNPIATFTMREHRKAPITGDLVPRRISVVEYDAAGHLKRATQIRVLDVQLEPVLDKAVFQLKVPEGFQIVETRFGKPVAFMPMPRAEAASKLEEVKPKKRRSPAMRKTPMPTAAVPGKRRWVWCVGAVVVVAVLVLAVNRARGRTPSD